MPEPVTFVTFIIPTINREHLNITLRSIEDQTDWNWKAIVVFDGMEPVKFENDHIISISCPKQGNGGAVRNYAFDMVDTKWIAFVDDDDHISPSYVYRLKELAGIYPDVDVFQFTYSDMSNGNKRPSKHYDSPVLGEMGISFAVKASLIQDNNIRFQPKGCEDYFFLEDCIKHGAKYFSTDEVLYFVSKRGCWL